MDSPERHSRRQFLQSSLALAGLGLLPGCGALPAGVTPARAHRIGFLGAGLPSASADRTEAFRQGLRELGYVEGANLVIEYRYAEGKLDRLAALATELVQLKVDIIVTAAPSSTRAAKEATSTIPIVMAYDTDPVGNGFVASLARPGGNITGLSSLAPGINGKQLEILKEIVPGLSRAAVLGTSALQPTDNCQRSWNSPRWRLGCSFNTSTSWVPRVSRRRSGRRAMGALMGPS